LKEACHGEIFALCYYQNFGIGQPIEINITSLQAEPGLLLKMDQQHLQ
jgi:hypothetical protein